jgi:flagellar biosynthesis/type III secretory pathway protein FliH
LHIAKAHQESNKHLEMGFQKFWRKGATKAKKKKRNGDILQDKFPSLMQIISMIYTYLSWSGRYF